MKFLLLLITTAVSTTAFAFVAPTLRHRSSTSSSSTSLVSLHAATRLLDRATGQSQLDPTVIDRYQSLPFPADTILAEYVWVDAVGNTRSKTRTLPTKKAASVDTLPKWNFDGSSTGQAPGDDSEVLLYPRRIFSDPFRPGAPNILVLCDCYTPAGEPIPSNTRAPAAAIFAKYESEEPWFGLEQEFTLFNLDTKTPLGWPSEGMPLRPQGPYYCSVGPENYYGRAVTEAVYKACLFAGISISGVNGEVMPGQAEYQVGPCVGIDSGDQVTMSRYILQRVCEDFQVHVSIHPKPITAGDWNGAGMHTNISTKKMRETGGLQDIKEAIYKLGAKHKEHIAVYGKDNELRLTGKFETASIDQFSYGVANRGASVRIGRDTEAAGCGYFEDRRPSSNADPYIVTSKIMETIMGPKAPEIKPKDKEAA